MKRLMSKIFIAIIGFLSFLGISLSFLYKMILAKKPKKGGYVMNNLVRLMLVCMLILGSMLMIKAAPAYAAEAMQMWKCELEGDTTEEEVITMAQEWVKAAKTMAGGKGLEANVYFPVAVNVTGKTDVLFAIHADLPAVCFNRELAEREAKTR